MSKSEKRYFKIYTTTLQHSKNAVYIKLFEKIERQKIYNENAIIKKYPELKKSSLSVNKNYLYRLILRSLRHFNADSPDYRSYTDLHNAGILAEKNLYKQSDKLLHSLKKRVSTFQQFQLNTEIIRWERRNLLSESDPENLHDHLLQTATEERKLLMEQLVINSYLKNYIAINKAYYNFGPPRSKEVMNHYKKCLPAKLSTTEISALPFMAAHYYHSAMAIFKRITASYKESIFHYNSICLQRENNALETTDQISSYVTALHNLNIVQRRSRLYTEAWKTLEKIKKLQSAIAKKNRVFLAQRVNSLLYIMELNFFCDTGEFEKALQTRQKYESLVRQEELAIKNKYELYYKSAYANLGLGHFKPSLKWLNKALQEVKIENMPLDNYIALFCLTLMIHYELGNDLIIENTIKSADRHLKVSGKNFPFETKLLQLFSRKFRQLMKRNKVNEQNLLKDFLQQIQHLGEAHYESISLDYIEIKSWLQSKIEKRPFAEVVKRNRKRVTK